MKRILVSKYIKTLSVLLSLLSVFSYSQAQNSSPLSDVYCFSTNGCSTYITSVIVGSNNNSGTVCSTNGYGSYTSMVIQITIGTSISVQITGANTSANTVCGLWVDWNRDNDLLDAGESITLAGSPGVGPYTATLTAPFDAVAGITRLRVRIGAGSVVPCGSATVGETEDYSLLVNPAVTITNVGSPNLCIEKPVNVNFTAAATFNSGNQFVLQLSDEFGEFYSPVAIGTLTGTLSGTIIATSPAWMYPSGSYRIRIVTTNPVTTSLDNGTDLGVYMPPNLQITTPQEVCAPATINITNSWSDLNNISGTVTYWTNPECTIALSNPTAVSLGGTYYIKKTPVANGCADIKPINVNIHPQPMVNAGMDQTIFTGNSVTLAAMISGGTAPYTYQWSPASGLNNPSVLNPIASPVASTMYTLSASDSYGCSSSDDVVVNVLAGSATTINGNVNYLNSSLTAMTNTTVFLKDQQGNIVTQTITDSNGHYEFSNVTPGTYTITASCTKPWGGGNAVDALLIMKHFVNMQVLTGLNLTAADVDGSGFVNSVDALTTMKRFVNMQTYFVTGNWAFQTFVVVAAEATTTTQNIKALCYGDTDSSFTPAL